MMTLTEELKSLFDHDVSFAEMMALRGEVYRELENRRTQRIVLGNQAVFIKQHFGIGWKEIFKNLFQLRMPVTSAKNEWQAIKRLQQIPVPTLTVLGYGSQGNNPARIQSFLITRELPPHVSLEDLAKQWQKNPPKPWFKWKLIREVAKITRMMHASGINHRDFYICHLVLENKVLENLTRESLLSLHVIDLHRAQLRAKTPLRWIIKDLAGLYFSSKDCGLSQRDWLRFIKEYRNEALRKVLSSEHEFWQKVKERGDTLYQKHANQ